MSSDSIGPRQRILYPAPDIVCGKPYWRHGALSWHPLWDRWRRMIDRCHGRKPHRDYGGRGIKVCRRWRESFVAFLEDVGMPPTPAHSLDRYPDVNGDYEPGNVRWATPKEQRHNTRRDLRVTIGGRRMMISEWCAELGVFRSTIEGRSHRRGTSVAQELRRVIYAREHGINIYWKHYRPFPWEPAAVKEDARAKRKATG